jgi:hypothetical protein
MHYGNRELAQAQSTSIAARPERNLQRDNSRLALAAFNVREVPPVHVEMDGDSICV